MKRRAFVTGAALAACAAWTRSVRALGAPDASALPHPRLRFRAADDPLVALRSADSLDAPRAAIRARVLAAADADLAAPLPAYARNGRRLASRVNAVNLAAAARITGDRRYADRALANLLAGGTWPDWAPGHYLGTAAVLLEYATAYDWLADGLSAADRAKVFAVVRRQAFDPISVFTWWRYTRENWALVCYGAIAAAAIAFAEHFPSEAKRWVDEAVARVARALEPYAPNGAYPEGPGYWEYGTGHCVKMLQALRCAYGTAFGLDEAAGFASTAEYVLAMTGPTGRLFNYSDCGDLRRRPLPAFAHFAARTGRAELAAAEISAWRAGALGADALEYLLTPGFAELAGRTGSAGAPTAPAGVWLSGGETPVAALRTGGGADAAYAGVKGGSAGTNHAHMDVGSFVFERDGVRWAHDLGNQKYAALERALGGHSKLWDARRGSKRWRVFRLGPFSHNLVTVDGAMQEVSARAEIEPAGANGVRLDLTAAFGGAVSRAVRSVVLDPATRVLDVRDEFAGARVGARFRWACTTDAAVEVDAGGRTATLSARDANGSPRRCRVRVAEPPGAAWRVEDASRPREKWDAPNPGFRQLVLEIPAPAEAFAIRTLFGEEPA